MLSKLRRRFTLDTVLLTLFILIGSIALLIVASYNYSQRSSFERMEELLDEVTIDTVTVGKDADGKQTATFYDWAIPLGDDTAVLLLSEDGEVLDVVCAKKTFRATIEENLSSIADFLNTAESDSGTVPGLPMRYMEQDFPGVGTKVAVYDRTTEIDGVYFQLRLYIGLAFIVMILVLILCDYLAHRAIQPVDDAIRTQQQFIADASHELKTPLTVILANLDIISSHPDYTVKESEKWIENTKSETKRMSRLVNEMLFLARSDVAMDMNYNFHLIDFGEVVDEVVLTTEALAFERNITLSEDLAENVLVVGDFERLKQAVMILVENATKYVDEGGRIDVRLTLPSRRSCLLTVTNSGDPIPEDKAAHIFDRFYRAEESRTRETGGYGLGLAIAKNIVQKHNGELQLDYSNENGTCFSIRLPHAQSFRAPELTARPEPESPSEAFDETV